MSGSFALRFDMEMFSMKGKVVAITGGAGGIGFEVARAMAEAGGDVAIWYDCFSV